VDAPARQAAIDVLFPPLYNSVRGQNWRVDGHWRDPTFKRRLWKTAYGVAGADMHRAMAFLMYPAFASEYASPCTTRIWALKQKCEAFLQWMSRFGRIERGVLQNLRRRVRCDVPFVIRNYVYQVGQRVPGAPIADLLLSGYNAFSKCLILGGDLQAPTVVMPKEEAAVDVGTMVGTVGAFPAGNFGSYFGGHAEDACPFVTEEITTSEYHDGGLLAPNNADDFLDFGEGFEEEDDDEDGGDEEDPDADEEQGDVGTLPPGFPQPLSSLAFAMTPSLASLSSLRMLESCVAGPDTQLLMAELAAMPSPTKRGRYV
jgi:hypothetical protein